MILGLSAHDQELILKVFPSYSEIKEVIVFGSRAMGNYKDGSDIDLALKGNVSHSTLLQLKDKLEEELPLPYQFDLVVYDQIDSQDLKNHIDTFGKVIYKI